MSLELKTMADRKEMREKEFEKMKKSGPKMSFKDVGSEQTARATSFALERERHHIARATNLALE